MKHWQHLTHKILTAGLLTARAPAVAGSNTAVAQHTPSQLMQPTEAAGVELEHSQAVPLSEAEAPVPFGRKPEDSMPAAHAVPAAPSQPPSAPAASGTSA